MAPSSPTKSDHSHHGGPSYNASAIEIVQKHVKRVKGKIDTTNRVVSAYTTKKNGPPADPKILAHAQKATVTVEDYVEHAMDIWDVMNESMEKIVPRDIHPLVRQVLTSATKDAGQRILRIAQTTLHDLKPVLFMNGCTEDDMDSLSRVILATVKQNVNFTILEKKMMGLINEQITSCHEKILQALLNSTEVSLEKKLNSISTSISSGRDQIIESNDPSTVSFGQVKDRFSSSITLEESMASKSNAAATQDRTGSNSPTVSLKSMKSKSEVTTSTVNAAATATTTSTNTAPLEKSNSSGSMLNRSLSSSLQTVTTNGGASSNVVVEKKMEGAVRVLPVLPKDLLAKVKAVQADQEPITTKDEAETEATVANGSVKETAKPKQETIETTKSKSPEPKAEAEVESNEVKSANPPLLGDVRKRRPGNARRANRPGANIGTAVELNLDSVSMVSNDELSGGKASKPVTEEVQGTEGESNDDVAREQEQEEEEEEAKPERKTSVTQPWKTGGGVGPLAALAGVMRGSLKSKVAQLPSEESVETQSSPVPMSTSPEPISESKIVSPSSPSLSESRKRMSPMESPTNAPPKPASLRGKSRSPTRPTISNNTFERNDKVATSLPESIAPANKVDSEIVAATETTTSMTSNEDDPITYKWIKDMGGSAATSPMVETPKEPTPIKPSEPAAKETTPSSSPRLHRKELSNTETTSPRPSTPKSASSHRREASDSSRHRREGSETAKHRLDLTTDSGMTHRRSHSHSRSPSPKKLTHQGSSTSRLASPTPVESSTAPEKPTRKGDTQSTTTSTATSPVKPQRVRGPSNLVIPTTTSTSTTPSQSQRSSPTPRTSPKKQSSRQNFDNSTPKTGSLASVASQSTPSLQPAATKLKPSNSGLNNGASQSDLKVNEDIKPTPIAIPKPKKQNLPEMTPLETSKGASSSREVLPRSILSPTDSNVAKTNAQKAMEQAIFEQQVVDWLNRHLAEGNHLSRETLYTGLTDGVALIDALEAASGESIGKIQRTRLMPAHKMDNLNTAVRFLREKGLMISTTPDEISRCEKKSVLAMLNAILKFWP